MAEQGKNTFSESSDEQFDSSTGFSESTKRQLVEDMQYSYRAYAHANEESLIRVQERLEARLSQAQQEEKTVPSVKVYEQPQRKHMIQNISTRQKKTKWSRLSRTLSAIAAVLVVGIIVGSAAILFHAKNRSTTIGSAIQMPIVKATHTPALKDSCPNLIINDTGEQYVCSNGLETPLHITTTLRDEKVTLLAGYADAQRILLKYTFNGPATMYNQAPYIYSLTMQGVIELGGAAAQGYFDNKTHQSQTIVSFYSDKIPAGTKELQLRASFIVSKNNGLKITTGSVDFKLPFHAGKRVATINKTISIGGVPVTLDHVIVTTTQTTIYIKNDQIARKVEPQDAIYLSVGTWNSHNKIAEESAWMSNGKKTGTLIGWIVYINSPLMDQQGRWTLKIQPNVVGGTGTTPGVFTFTIPPAQ